MLARIFFHEATHLDYYMNAPGTNPETNDYAVRLRKGKSGFEDVLAYGPFYAKVLARYSGSPGKYTQRNCEFNALLSTAQICRCGTIAC